MKKLFALFLMVMSMQVLAAATLDNCKHPLVVGWNLAGVSVNIPLQYFFAEPEKIISVWRWNPGENTWSFASPQLPDSGLAFALSKGLHYLYAVRVHEGIWINAAAPTTFNSCMGNAVPPPSVPQ